MELQGGFKEFRRNYGLTPNKVSSESRIPCKTLRKYPNIASNTPPPKPIDGEDEFSFSQHNKLLKAEFGKRKPNKMLISNLMELSFPMRRSDITQNGYDGVTSLFKHYPLLQDYEQVLILLFHYCMMLTNFNFVVTNGNVQGSSKAFQLY